MNVTMTVTKEVFKQLKLATLKKSIAVNGEVKWKNPVKLIGQGKDGLYFVDYKGNACWIVEGQE